MTISVKVEMLESKVVPTVLADQSGASALMLERDKW